jgi:acetyl-CoA C-acetyltransferase
LIDPRTPVVVGVGQVNQRVEPAEARSPIELFVDAARIADAEARGMLAAADTVAVVLIGSWRYADPGAVAARRLGIEPRETIRSSLGGNSPQLLINELAADIQRGDRDVVLIGGGEVLDARRRARAMGGELEFERTDDPPCAHVIGNDDPGTNALENAHGAFAPTQVYPLFETALRGRAGRTIAHHQQAIGELWSHFAAVAAENPFAWTQVAYSAEEIAQVTPDNRMVTFPYTKRMNANVFVDQGAALLLSSYGTARAAGVPDDQLVFPHSGTDVHDHWWFTNRHSLATSVGIGAMANAALAAAGRGLGIGIDDIARFDLYSCFPSAVQLALDSLGLAGPSRDGRPLTVTGGLGFAGGPLNNYPTHAIARMVELLRADPGSFGLTTALGWYATKHSCGVWSTTPPNGGFRRVDPAVPQAQVDASPSRPALESYSGRATVEATAVPVDRDGTPTIGIVAAITDSGERVLANVHDPTALGEMMTEAWENHVVHITPAGATNRIDELRR